MINPSSGKSPTKVYLIPGFLTELPLPREGSREGALARLQRLLQSLIESSDPLQLIDGRGWVGALSAALPEEAQSSIELVSWPSRRLFELLPTLTPILRLLRRQRLTLFGRAALPQLLLSLGQSAWTLQQLWVAAREAADEASVQLAAQLRAGHPAGEPILLIGHSLGARLALRAALRCVENPVYVLALAPAMREQELIGEAKRPSSNFARLLEVGYSPDDRILQWLYPLAELGGALPFSQSSEALGSVGPRVGDLCIPLPCSPMGHLSYMDGLSRLLPRSQIWPLLNSMKSFRSPK